MALLVLGGISCFALRSVPLPAIVNSRGSLFIPTNHKYALNSGNKIIQGAPGEAVGPRTLSMKLMSSSSEKEGVEPKYIIALVVFLLACVYDKIVMHGGF